MNGQRWSTLGSVAAAAASSACCWLPLAMVAFGTSAVGASAFLERLRIPFLVIATVLLALGFVLHYRQPRDGCAEDGTCPPTAPRQRHFNALMLWVSTLLVAALAFFPQYVGQLVRSPSAAFSTGDTATLVLDIEGMTCAGCEASLEAALSRLPNVVAVEADHLAGRATVRTPIGNAPGVDALEAAVVSAGYSLHAIEEGLSRKPPEDTKR